MTLDELEEATKRLDALDARRAALKAGIVGGIVALRADGKSLRTIGKSAGLTSAGVLYIVRQAGTRKSPRSEGPGL